MIRLIRDAVHDIWSAFTRPSDLMLENIALKHQLNVVLRTSPPRPRLSAIDRILWVWLSRTWSGWKESIRIVRPDTVIAWHRRGWRLYWTWRSKRRGPGRPLIAQDARDLIRKMSAENVTWGAPRIHGELRKLGVEVSQATVAKYMVRHNKPPSQSWRTFPDNHVTSLASIDFFTVPTIRLGVLYVFLVLAHDRRRALHFNVTANPTAEWTARQITEAFPWNTARRYMIRDRDGVYGDVFRQRVKTMGIDEVLIAPRSPWQSPYVERLIGSIRRECLDHIIVLSELHLRGVLREYFDNYYHPTRTHLALGKDSPIPRPVQPLEMGEVISLPVLGGLHHRHERRAA
jgi:putative transposase